MTAKEFLKTKILEVLSNDPNINFLNSIYILEEIVMELKATNRDLNETMSSEATKRPEGA